ncbi:MAG: Phosphatidylinositol-4-phosphate 5-kinase [Phylliscum demangeonii]|nr:MAG: Phosphatidylinositol-4-phosphate 5-kinase [Phylliscum demangeonii]
MQDFAPRGRVIKTFHLKGSTIGRDFREEHLEWNAGATLKDLHCLLRRDVALLLRDQTLQLFQPGGEHAHHHHHHHHAADAVRGPGPSASGDTGTGTGTSTMTTHLDGSMSRRPSKSETARKARELREMIKTIGQLPRKDDKMADEMPAEDHSRMSFTLFYGDDDGGFRASHDDDSPHRLLDARTCTPSFYHPGPGWLAGWLPDIRPRTRTVRRPQTRRTLHFWKALSHPNAQISPVKAESDDDRSGRFIGAITQSAEV